MRIALKIYILSLSLLFIFSGSVFAAFPAFTEGEGVYVFEEKSGDPIIAEHENERYIPASTTKMMTAILLNKYVSDFNQEVTVGPEISVYGYGDSTAGLWQGQKLTYRDLLYALLLPSGNDAAGTISVNVGRILLNDPNADWQTAKKTFINEMNKEAQALGATQTHFMNPQGTYEPEHYSTPKDFSKIVAEAVKYDTVREVSQTPNYVLKKADGTDNVINNTNFLIIQPVSPNITPQEKAALQSAQQRAKEKDQPVPSVPEDPGTDKTGLITIGKTGTTSEGGRTFVFYSEQNGAQVVGVLFKTGDTDIFTQSQQITEELNRNYRLTSFSGDDGTVETVNLVDKSIFHNLKLDLKANGEVFRYSNINEPSDYTTSIRYDDDKIVETDGGPSVVSSIDEGDKVGAMIIKNNGNVIKTVPLYAGNSIPIISLGDLFVKTPFRLEYVGVAFLFAITIMSLVLIRKRRSARQAIRFT